MAGYTVPQFNELKLAAKDSWSFLLTRLFNPTSPENIGHNILISKFLRSIIADTPSPVPIDEGIEVLKMIEAIKSPLIRRATHN